MVLAQIFGLGPFGGVRGPGPSPPPASACRRTHEISNSARKATGVRRAFSAGADGPSEAGESAAGGGGGDGGGS